MPLSSGHIRNRVCFISFYFLHPSQFPRHMKICPCMLSFPVSRFYLSTMGGFWEPNCGGIDASAGGLVWVRLRNGSWWPGQVMALDESPQAWSLPNLGTPIKLLGRENARTELYHLDKMKCVKAFRCGEFDTCIEKAKVWANHLTRPGVKCTRRDGAILQALELENACTPAPCHGSSLNVNIFAGNDIDGREIAKVNVYAPEDKTMRDLPESAISLELPNETHMLGKEPLINKQRQKLQSGSTHTSKGRKRMKDLKDLGLRVVSIRECSGHVEPFLPESSSLTETTICNSFSNNIPVNSSKISLLSQHKGHSQIDPLHESFKRKSRHLPLSKVLENTEKLTDNAVLDKKVTKAKLLESKEEKMGFSLIVNTNMDSTGSSHVKDITSSTASKYIGADSVDSSQFPLASGAKKTEGYVGSRPLNLKESGGPWIMNFTDHSPGSKSAGKETTACQLKRKNVRWLSNAEESSFQSDAYFVQGGNSCNESQMLDAHVPRGKTSECWMNQASDTIVWHGSRTLPVCWISSPNSVHNEEFNLTGTPNVSPYLYDVHLDVQGAYVAGHVPLVSFRSKVNGKAIIGHPVTVEVLRDGDCDLLLTNMNCSQADGTAKQLSYFCGFSAKGIEKLSSLAADGANYRVVMEQLGAPFVACVPVRTVFNRINGSLSLLSD